MDTNAILASWQGQTAVLGTKHHKEAVIAPLMQQGLGINIIVPAQFDSDQFGTFTRDIRRTDNQLETAKKKARAAISISGLPIGLASEGSFSAHPSIPFVQSNLELVVLIDTVHDLEIVGQYRTSTVRAKGATVTSFAEARALVETWDFPKQGVIVRAGENNYTHLYKDITTLPALEEACSRLLSKWFVRSIYIETDMRAHRCPARMESITRATLDLIQNCQNICPNCATPGFVITETVKGLPCSQCKLPTDMTRETIYTCRTCLYHERKPATVNQYAEPGACQWCNP